MMICNILNDLDVMYTILRVTVRRCPGDFFVWLEWTIPFFSLELVFLPSNGYAYMLTGPLNFVNEC